MIFHITAVGDWADAQIRGRYEAPSLSDEGFIHCSTAAQVAATANRFYADRVDLILLAIDPRRLAVEVRYENTEGGDVLFPHVYGAVELGAVTDARPWRPTEGRFTTPSWIDTLGS